jgi:hypothetical protein
MHHTFHMHATTYTIDPTSHICVGDIQEMKIGA